MANFSQILFFWVLLFFPKQILAAPANTQEAIITLNQAVQFYQMSDRTEAMQRFLSISMNDSYPESVKQEARIYMAEILLIEGNADGAKIFIQDTLDSNFEYQIDRFRHPPEICDFFDETKAIMPQIKPIKENPIEVRTYLPTSIFLPLGVHQIRRKQYLRGVVCSSSQVLLASGSIWMRSYIRSNQNPDAPSKDEARLNNMLIGQWSSSALFYLTWAGCTLDAYRTWKKETKSSPKRE
jgi:hypothetical protein